MPMVCKPHMMNHGPGSASLIWWTIQSAIILGSSWNDTSWAVSQAFLCLFQHQKMPTHQYRSIWISMCQVMTIPQDQQPWVYTHPLRFAITPSVSSAGTPSPASHCHRPQFGMVFRSQCLWKIWGATRAVTDWHKFKHIHMHVYVYIYIFIYIYTYPNICVYIYTYIGI